MLIASNAEVILVKDKKPNKQESFDILASFFVDLLHVLQSFSVSWSTIDNFEVRWNPVFNRCN